MARNTLDVVVRAAWEKFFRTGSKLSEVAWGTCSEKSVQSEFLLGSLSFFHLPIHSLSRERSKTAGMRFEPARRAVWDVPDRRPQSW